MTQSPNDIVEFLDDGTVAGVSLESTEDRFELYIEGALEVQAVDRADFLEFSDEMGPTGPPGPGVRVWKTGDADPTEGGSVTLDSTDFWFFVLGSADPVPSWAPSPSIIYRY